MRKRFIELRKGWGLRERWELIRLIFSYLKKELERFEFIINYVRNGVRDVENEFIGGFWKFWFFFWLF